MNDKITDIEEQAIRDQMREDDESLSVVIVTLLMVFFPVWFSILGILIAISIVN